jgi:osmotically-inducible protein OsmY
MLQLQEQLDRIAERISAEVGIPVIIEGDGPDAVTVLGMVQDEEERDAILRVAAEVAPDVRIDDGLEVVGVFPAEVAGISGARDAIGGGVENDGSGYRETSLEAGDFMDERGITDPWSASGPTSALDDDLVSEGDLVYTPPTDPVGTNTEVINGLALSSMDDIHVARSALDGRLGDEAIADAIRRELLEDAATTDLDVDVSVFDGVAHLRGRVPYLEDAENAEEVASRVPGVVEVDEGLDVDALEER